MHNYNQNPKQLKQLVWIDEYASFLNVPLFESEEIKFWLQSLAKYRQKLDGMDQ